MKKLSLILLSVIILLTGSCNTWMQDDNFYSDIENDVKVANAKQISVYVRYAMTRQGKTDPDGSATFKVEIPHEISATTEPEYGFVRWAAFPTSYLATGDNQSKNKDIYFIDEDDYNERILPNEIQSPQVVFEDASKPNTSVKINVERNDIYLCPIVAQRPVVSLTIPAKGSSGVVRNMTVRINFSKPMDPESFKNEAGVYDKITVTQGIQSFSADGDIEVSSEDITNRFREPEFSANGKMVTLKFTAEAISEGYASQSSVNITISKDVKDIYGFSMADDDKISFSVGSSMDTLAPRITDLTAGPSISTFHKFKGMYKDADTWNAIQAYTKMEAHLHGSTYLGSANAPTNNIDNAFFDTFAPADTPENASNEGYRVTNKLYIRVFAEDIAGSGSNQDQTGIESDVTMIGIRATPMYNADGSPSTAESVFRASNYMPQANMTGEPGVYKNLIQAVNEHIPGTDNDFAEDKGCLYTFDLSSLPDGLIRVDVAAVDMVQNNGFSDGGALSSEYGNGYASLFVVKDTTAPDASLNADRVQPNTASTTGITADWYYNPTTFANVTVNESSTNHIIDSGHERLRAKHSNLKWTVRLTNDETWKNQLPANPNSSPWSSVANPISFAGQYPATQNLIHFTYALIDDMGNISNVAAVTPPQPVYYDSDAPAVQSLYFDATPGNTAGIAKENILKYQKLIIPVTEIESGIKKIEIQIRKNGESGDYGTPFAAKDITGSNFGVWVNGTPTTDFTVSGTTLTFNNRINNFNSNIIIQGLKISETTAEGSYTIKANIIDAANNSTPVSVIDSTCCTLDIDSVRPKVKMIYIPNLKQTERLSTSTPEYWIDYTADTLHKQTGSNPRTEVIIKFEEESSGAKIFDFSGSSIHLTPTSMIYKYNLSTKAIEGIAIPSTVELDQNGIPTGRLILNSAQDAEGHKYLAGTGDIAAKITDIELAPEGTASNVSLIISDTATNASTNSENEPTDAAQKFISNENSLNFDTPTITTTNFKFDSAIPGVSTPHGSLFDRNGTESVSTATSAEGKTAAELGYTNETYVNETITLTPTASGIDSLTIVGDAVFFKDESNPANPNNTTIYIGTTPVYFNITNSGKTVTFKKAEADNTHIILAPAAGSTTVSITINNLLLTSGDGEKSVTVKPRSFGGLADATGANDTIVLDMTPPKWGPVDTNGAEGTGLYVAYNSSLTSASIYPHPVSGSKVYGFTNVPSAPQNDVYFYRYSNICIKPEISDNNPKADTSLIEYKNSSGTVLSNNNAAFSPSSTNGYTNQTGTFTATIRDRAGNKSTVKTFHIVADSTFASSDTDKAQIDQYMTLYKPTGAFIHRNATRSGDTTEYVIKGSAQYQIRVKLGGATTVSNEYGNEETIGLNASATTLLTDPYIRKDNTTDSSGIEYFSVSTFTSTNISDTPSTPSSSYWKPYSSGNYTIGSLSTHVDAAGTITIDIPTSGCDPLVLWLKDGCNNYTWRKIRPVAMTPSSSQSVVRWTVDTEVGAIEDGNNFKGTPSYTGSYSINSDVSFYRVPITLKIDTLTESCRFDNGEDNTPLFPTDPTASSFAYTMKSRIIAWTGSGVPTREAFGNNDGSKPSTTPAASDWCFVKQAQSGDYPVFYVQNSFPQFTASTRYKLFLIMEDTVGNYVIKQIKRGSDGIVVSPNNTDSTVSGVEYWYYDADPPRVTAATEMTYNNINTVDGKNYYSTNSSIQYTIEDDGAGIWWDGVTDTAYPGFGGRRTINKTYSLSSITPNSDKTIKIVTTKIKDYAGNAIASDIVFNYGGSTEWIKQTSAPTLKTTSGTPASVVAINTSLSDNPSTAIARTYGLTHYDDPAADDTTGGHTLNLTSKAINTKITVRLQTTEANDAILGWIVSSSKLTSFQNFYTASDMSPLVTWDSSNSCWKYSFSKSNTSTPWHEAFSGETYFYPVNRAGLICQRPIKVKFAENLKPGITGSISYSLSNPINGDYINAEKPSTPYTIMYVTDGINYTKSGAKVIFTTENAPTTCKILWAPGTNGNYTDDDAEGKTFTLSSYKKSGTSSTYEIPLNNDDIISHTSTTTGSELRIRLFTAGEDSDVYVLTGPSGANSWVYDNGSPTITSTDLKTKAPYVDSEGNNQTNDGEPETYNSTKYIQSAKATLTLTATEFSSTGAGAVTGIAHRQWRWSENGGTSYNSWRDISSDDMNAELSGTTLTFDAPAKKTTIQFRTIDTAGNISTSTPAITLQRDDQAPNGEFTYKTRKGNATSSSATGNVDLTDAGRGTGKGSDNPYGGDESDRAISYSNNEDSPYYITHIWFDLSKITDKYTAANAADPENGIERSGIKNFIIKKDGTQLGEPLSATTTSSVIDLDGVTGAHVYEIWAEDNIGQQRKLQTFRTDLDGTAPVLTSPATPVQAKDDAGENASNAVLYPATSGTYYLKNTKAYITFNIDDAFATYEWSTTNGSSASDWHNTNHTEVAATSTSVTFIFDAPDTPTTYYFRGTDRVGNCSTTVSTNSLKIQKDMEAPNGTLTWDIFDSTTSGAASKKETLQNATLEGADRNLITEDTTTGTITIKYSSRNETGITKSAYYLKKMTIDLSDIAADADESTHSGFENFYVSIDGGAVTAITDVSESGFSYDSPTKILTLTLPDNSNTEKSYQLSVKDNIENSRTLKTFVLKPDATAPTFIGQTIYSDEGKTVEALTSSDTSDTTKYLDGDKAIVLFSNVDTTAVYRWSNSDAATATWSTANSAIDGTDLVYTFDAPAAKTNFYFQGEDLVGNITTTEVTKLQQDNAVPTGLFEYKFKNAAADTTTGYVDNQVGDSTITRAITYNTSTVTGIEFDYSALADSASGIEGYYLNDTKLSATSSPAIDTTTKKCLASLATAHGTVTEYVLKVKDNVGHERTLATITLTADAEAPALSLASEHPIQTKSSGNTYDGVLVSGTYYLSRNNAIINMTKAATDTDIVKYEFKAEGEEIYTDITNNENLIKTDSSITYTFGSPETATTYTFKFTDKVGHTQELPVGTLVKDTTKPALAEGTSLGYTVMKDDDNEAQIVDATHKLGDYMTSLSAEGTTIITYHKDRANKVVFDLTNIVETGSGLEKLYYKVNGGSATAMTGASYNELELPDDLNGAIYQIYAYDKVTNKSEELLTLIFTADSTGPVITDTSVLHTENSINKLGGYSARKPDGAGGYIEIGDIPFATQKARGTDNRAKTNYYANGTQVLFAKTSLADAVQYQFVQAVTPATNPVNNGFNATAGTEWQPLSDGTEDGSGSNYILTIPENITTIYTRLAIFFTDALGNPSGAYYLGNNKSDQHGIQWWLLDTSLTAPQITISNATWQTPNQYNNTTYNNVKVSLPEGVIVHSIEGGDSNVTIKKVTFKEANTAFDNNFNNLEYVYQPNGSNPGIELNIEVAKEVTDSSAVKIKINGVEQGVFVAVSGSFFGGSGRTSGITGITGTGRKAQDSDSGAQASGGSRDSRITQFFNNLSNAFISKPEVSTDTSVSEKPVTTAKKATKKAAKKAKKQTANATQKASPVTAPVAVTETAEIITPNVISEVIETSVAAPEAKVNVAESSVVEAQGSTSSTVAPASEPAEKRVPSKSASIVIMLSIICSIGVVLYLNKSRKK